MAFVIDKLSCYEWYMYSFNLKMKSLFKNMIYKIRLFIYKSFRYFLYMCCGIIKTNYCLI